MLRTGSECVAQEGDRNANDPSATFAIPDQALASRNFALPIETSAPGQAVFLDTETSGAKIPRAANLIGICMRRNRMRFASTHLLRLALLVALCVQANAGASQAAGPSVAAASAGSLSPPTLQTPSPPSSSSSSPAPAPSASTPIAIQLTNWPTHENTFLSDILKGLLGTFFGAALAFYLSSLQRKNQELRENVAAGNLALFSIRAMSKSLSEMRLSVRDDVTRHRRLNDSIPIWALARSWVYRPIEDLKFDYGSLTFLLDTRRGREAMLQLRYVEEIYKGALHVYEVNQELSRQYKDVFEKAFGPNVTEHGEIDWGGIEKALGTRLVVERATYLQSMIYTTEIEIDQVRIAFDLLAAELKARFAGDAWDLEFFPSPASNRHESRLPAYPADILNFLQERRDVEARAKARESEIKSSA